MGQQKNRKLKSRYIALFSSYVLIVLSFLIIAFISKKYDIPPAYFTGDPALIFDKHPLIGVVSNIGILFWSFTVAICFFSGMILKKSDNTEMAEFFKFSGFFTLFLLLDDLFMFHDRLFFQYFHISQKLTYLAYFILIIIFLVKFGKLIILKTDYIVFIFACMFLSLSVLCDLLLPQSQEGINYLIEDGLKFLGIFTWFVFFVGSSYFEVFQIGSKR